MVTLVRYVCFSQERKKKLANFATLFCVNHRGVKSCQIWECFYLSLTWLCMIAKVQRVKSQAQIHQGKGNWLKCHLDLNSLWRGKMVLLSSSCCPFSFCTFLSVRELFTGTFTIWLLTTSSSSHYFSIRSRELATCFFSAWYRLFGRDTASSFLLPLSEILWFVLLAIFMTPVYFATKAHTLGIMTPMHQVQSETTTKDDSCPEYLPFSQPVSQPVLAEMGEKKLENGTKENSAAGALRFSHVDIFGAGSLPCFTMQLFKRWHFNTVHLRRTGKAGSRADGPPWVESSARRTSGDTGTAIADYFFYAFSPALSLCFSFETELCFRLVARGSGLERGDFYWATKRIVCTGRKCVKNWNYMVVLGVCCGGNTGSHLLVANGAWWDDLKMKWVWYAGTWHLKRIVKLYFLFSFVQRECILALSTKCVIVGYFQSGSCLQNRSHAVCSSLFPFCFTTADCAQNTR